MLHELSNLLFFKITVVQLANRYLLISVMAPSKTNKEAMVKNSKVPKSKLKKKNFFIKAATIQSTQQVESNVEAKPNPSTLKTIAKLPSKPEEAGSNWKSLCSTLKPTTPAHAKYLAKKKEKKVKEELKSVEVAQKESENNLEVWFDDVDPILLDTKPSGEQSDLKTDAAGKTSNE